MVNKVRLRKRSKEDPRDLLIKEQREELSELRVAMKALQVRNKELEAYVPDENREPNPDYDFNVRYYADSDKQDYHLAITRERNPHETTTIQLSSADIENRMFIVKANAYGLIGHIINELRKIYTDMDDLTVVELERDITFQLRASGVID